MDDKEITFEIVEAADLQVRIQAINYQSSGFEDQIFMVQNLFGSNINIS